MKTLAKLAGAVALLLLLLAAAAPFILKRFLPPERVRAIVTTQAQKALGREVRVSAVSYSLMKGLSLEDLAVSEKPTFEAGTFVSVKRFHLSAALLPLLKRTLVIDRVAADGLRLTVIKRGDGSYNFSDLLRDSTAATATAATPPTGQAVPGQSFSMGVKAAAISDGRLEYRDEAASEALKISDLSLKAKGIRLSGAFDADVSARAKGVYGGRVVDAAAALSGRFDLGGQNPRRFAAELKKVSVEYGDFAVRGSMKMKGLEETDGELDLKISREGRELAQVEWAGKARRAAGAGLGVFLDGKIKAKTTGLKREELAALGIPSMGMVPPMRAAGAIRLSGAELTARGLEVETPVGKATIDGGARGIGTQALEPDLSAALDLDLPEISSAQLPAGALPKGLRLPPMAVSGKVRVKGDSAVFEKLRARLKQGTLEVNGSATGLRAGKPRADVEVSAKLDVPELAASDLAFLSMPKGYTSPAFSVEGKARLKGDDALLDNLRLRGKGGTVDLNGSIKNLKTAPDPALDVVAKLALPALKASDAPFLPLPDGFTLPASRWDVDLFASRDDVRVKTFRAVVGSNDVAVEKDGRLTGLRGKSPSANILVKCRQFALEELSDLTPAIHELGIKGSGFFALSVAGPLDKPVLGGKLQFKTLSAFVAGLKLDGFTGTASFDEKRIDAPNLRGKVDNGELKLDLTIKNYAAKPDVDVEASLSEFDLGKFFAARAQVADSRDAAAVAKGKPKPSEKPAQAMDLKGKFTIGRLFHPNFEAKDVRSSWQLTDYTPDYKRLGGMAKFSVAGGGYLKDLGKASTQSKLVKVLLLPITIIQKIGRLGGLQVFPNFDDVSYTEMTGDYAFAGGQMRINESRMNANVGDVQASGAIDLPAERLDMTIAGQFRNVPPVEIAVGGTFDQPKTRVKLEKIFAEPAKQLIEGIFKRK